MISPAERAKDLLSKHGCSFITMVSECRVIWKNQSGIIRADDIAVLSHMSEKAWDFWKVN